MAQHFLLSAAARTLSLKTIYRDGEEKAYAKFCEIRWTETKGAPVCSRCGSLDHYAIPTRRKFQCRDCGWITVAEIGGKYCCLSTFLPNFGCGFFKPRLTTRHQCD